MRDLRESCRIAVVQAAPVMFDKAACTVKAVELIRAAAAERAELIVFPELFIPGYPYGMTFGFTVGSRTAPGRKDWGLYYDNSILVPGPETEILGRAAREARAYVSIGVSERDAVNATLYNTNLIFSPAGELLTVHRKLKPTDRAAVYLFYYEGYSTGEIAGMLRTNQSAVTSRLCRARKRLKILLEQEGYYETGL